MPNPNEAREEAWRELSVGDDNGRYEFRAGWDARGRYDEQRIAALVEAATRAQLFFATRQGKLGIYDRIGRDFIDALRALAALEEAGGAPTDSE